MYYVQQYCTETWSEVSRRSRVCSSHYCSYSILSIYIHVFLHLLHCSTEVHCECSTVDAPWMQHAPWIQHCTLGVMHKARLRYSSLRRLGMRAILYIWWASKSLPHRISNTRQTCIVRPRGLRLKYIMNPDAGRPRIPRKLGGRQTDTRVNLNSRLL